MGDSQTRPLWVVYWAYLLSSIPVFRWYDETALSALLNPSSDAAGNLVFRSGATTVYAFTIAAAVLGLLVTSLVIWTQVGGLMGLVMAVLVARASTLATFEIYELTFVAIGHALYGWTTLTEHIIPNADWVALKAAYLSVLAPWVKRRNVRWVSIAVVANLLLFLIWAALGYKLPESGDPIGYLLNAATRLMMPIIPALLVANRDRRSPNSLSQPDLRS
ncbi:MAG: hypothetical protein RMJ30_03505 [Nitrososphaerota archaeon]|nr:hypothetical protein [Nitrososphaerota archaeon]